MKIAFLPPAQIELDEAFSWCEEQAVGLGFEFLDELDQTLRLIATFPEFHPLVDKKLRRCLSIDFPTASYMASPTTPLPWSPLLI